jgi:heat shock protein HspQ
MTVIGWTGAWDNIVPVSTLTKEKEKAIVERIRKRKYNFNQFDHEMLPYASPVFDDKTTCILTKAQWDRVMSEAYKDIPFSQRLMPQDVIDDVPVGGILYEKKKFYAEGENNNG